MPGPLIILGGSARAAAESARRAGFEPWCVDMFCDRDLQRIATARRCPPTEYPTGMLPMLEAAPAEAPVLLTGGLENYPELLEAISFEHPLLGSSVSSIRQVRDPLALPSLPAISGLRFCKTRVGGSLGQRIGQFVFGSAWGNRYLLKPRRSVGGVNIRWWRAGMKVDENHYVQQFVPGTPHSAVFASDGWSATTLGVTQQLVGEPEFGAPPWRYCGSLGPVMLNEWQRAALAHLAVQLTQRYDVRGIFGVDLVIDRRGRLWPLEVNPRYVASIEVLERAFRIPLLSGLSAESAQPTPRRGRTAHQWHGKAIVFARLDVRLGELYEVLAEHEIADVPTPGTKVRAGRPICTVFAVGPTREACYENLAQKARKIHEHHGVPVYQ